MSEPYEQVLKASLTDEHIEKLLRLPNPKLHRFVAEAVELCGPDSVFVCTDAAEDVAYVRRLAIENSEETPLAREGHTIHFDGAKDQGRDKENTKYLVPPSVDLGAHLNSLDKEEGLAEVMTTLMS